MKHNINNVLYQNCNTCKDKDSSTCIECTACDIKTQMIHIAERIGGTALDKERK